MLERLPNDPVALATLGDASLELGDVAAARDAYGRARRDRPFRGDRGAPRRTWRSSPATPRPRSANARAAVDRGRRGGADGERAAFFRYQLADVLISTGDRAGAEKAYADALAVDPNSFLAHSGLGPGRGRRRRPRRRHQGADRGHRHRAAARVPRAPRRPVHAPGRAGDAKLATADYDTVEAIAQLAGEAARVYDRSLALYLANHGLDPDRAVALAAAELGAERTSTATTPTRGRCSRPVGRRRPTRRCSRRWPSAPRRQALYHAGMIDAALGRTDAARTKLERALDLDPSFDPLQAKRARETLAGLHVRTDPPLPPRAAAYDPATMHAHLFSTSVRLSRSERLRPARPGEPALLRAG